MMEATKVVSPVSISYAITVKWYKQRRIRPDGRYSYESLDPEEHFLHEKRNLRVDCLMPEQGKLVCEVSYGDRKKRRPVVRKLMVRKLMGNEWVKSKLPFRVPDGGAFRVRGWVYRVEFYKTLCRLQANYSWVEKGKVPEGTVTLVYPSGHPVTKERHGERTDELQAHLWQDPSAIVVGMQIAGFEPPARIVSVDVEGNKAVISSDPSFWVA